MHFSSCSSATSGCADCSQASTLGSRALMELTFQVAMHSIATTPWAMSRCSAIHASHGGEARPCHSQGCRPGACPRDPMSSEEHTSELQSLMRISYAVFCLKQQQQPEKLQTTRKATTHQ